MAEQKSPVTQPITKDVKDLRFSNLYTNLTNQTVGSYKFSDMVNAITSAEVGGDKTNIKGEPTKGWPYIFTKSGKTSSAFGPIQITYSTVLDYFVGAGSEKEQKARLNNNEFVAGFTQLPDGVKNYIKKFVAQGIKKRNNKKPQDGGAYGNLGVGDISKEDHEKYYPFLMGVHFREKKKLAKANPYSVDGNEVESFVNAHYGDTAHQNSDVQEKRTKSRNNLISKVNDSLALIAKPVRDPNLDPFKPLPETMLSDDSDVVEDGTTDTLETVMQEEFQRDVDAADRDEQKQQAATLETIQTKDVAPETLDAIPVIDVPAEPEQPGLFDRFMGMFSSDDRDAQNEKVRQDLLKELRTETIIPPAMNEGGMAMDRQMSMFEDGGLMDEGGTTDPVSGNDVPPGSTQEEVRDDIPAQLSEGEFVFPADVVRFIGLEKLMNLRQEAKAGLARMDAMGQMGNSEEATIPDDIPFTLDDLDIEDDPMEFQVGGLVPNQFGIMQQPSQFATYTPHSYQAPTIPVGQPVQQQPLQTGFTPLTTPAVPTGGGTVPTFEQLMPTTTGRYDELKEYINNETGQTMTIPFVDGQPIYPIPEGFVEVQTDVVEAVDPEETAVPTARPETVTGRDDPSDDQRMDDGLGPGGGRVTLGGEIFEGPTGFYGEGIKTRKFQGNVYGGTKVGVSFDMPSGIPGVMSGLSTAAGLATGKGIAKDATATFTLANETVTVDAVKYNKIKQAGFRGEEAEKIVAELQNKSRITAALRDRSKVKRQLEKAKETGDINKAAAAELKLAQIEATKMGVSIDGKTTSELKSETLAAVQRKAAENAAKKAAEQAANQGNTQYESDKGESRNEYSFESYSDNVAKGTEDRGYGSAYDSDVLGLAD